MSALRVVIAGSGVAGLEALLTLEELAGDRVDVTVISPQTAYRVRALATRTPFAGRSSPNWSVPQLCRRHGARYVQSAVQAVDAPAHEVELDRGRRVPYDVLIVTTGATTGRAIPGGSLFTDGPAEIERVHGLVQDVEECWTQSVAFVVPPGSTWPLPAYELALLLADRAEAMCIRDLALDVVTAEPEPLRVFGPSATAAVTDALTAAGVTLRAGIDVGEVDGRRIVDADGAVVAEAQRIVVLGRMRGRVVPGLPADADGFLPVDADGAVVGVEDVWAAGDGTTEPVKLGAVAARRATEAAHAIARRAGVEIATPAEPAPTAVLLAGRRSIALGGPGGAADGPPLVAALDKVAAPRLRRALGDGAGVS